MSLDPGKLNHVRHNADGSIQAQCPACAREGEDSKGEHLRVWPDGKFGCAKYPDNKQHRQLIHRLAKRTDANDEEGPSSDRFPKIGRSVVEPSRVLQRWTIAEILPKQ